MTPMNKAIEAVKPLEWKCDKASALGATWMVWEYSDPLNDGLGNWMWQSLDVAPHASGRCATKEAAKAAAQADYARRILSALNGIVCAAEPVGWMHDGQLWKSVAPTEDAIPLHAPIDAQTAKTLEEVGDLKDQRASLISRGIDPNLDTLPINTMTFSSDEDALDLLGRYGYSEAQNGVIREDSRCLDKNCRAAIDYLCDEWDFVFEDTAGSLPTDAQPLALDKPADALLDEVWNAAVIQAAMIAKDCVHLTPEPDKAIMTMLGGRSKLHLASAASHPDAATEAGAETPRLPVGTQVEKIGGYPFPGEIRASFTTRGGQERFVVEATGEQYAGMLHIFNGGQLRVALSSAPEGER